MKEILRCRCPMCGMMPEVERFDGDQPYPLELFLQFLGGKVKLTDEQRRARKGKPFKRGSAPGYISYHKLDGNQLEQLRQLVLKRAKQIADQSK